MNQDKSLSGIIDESGDKSGHMDPAWLASLPKGKINIVITAEGEWLYEGQPFERKNMVKLLAKQLVYYQGQYCLVAPEQLLVITVIDCPFIVSLVYKSANGDDICLTTNIDDEFVLGVKGHEMSLMPLVNDNIETPVVEVRPGLLARFSRPAYYQLVDMAEVIQTEKGSCLQIKSAGSCHLLGYID